MELVRSVRRDVDGVASLDDGFLSTKGGLHLSLKKDESLLEVVAMRRRATAGRNVHVDDAKASVGLVAGHRDGIGISHDADVRKTPIRIGLSNGEVALRVVGRNGRVLRSFLEHGGAPLVDLFWVLSVLTLTSRRTAGHNFAVINTAPTIAADLSVARRSRFIAGPSSSSWPGRGAQFLPGALREQSGRNPRSLHPPRSRPPS